MEVLPNDLVRQCLLRVPYESHDSLKAVCRGWEAMVSSPEFYADRKISATSEQLICLMLNDRWVDDNNFVSCPVLLITAYDPFKDTWKNLSRIHGPQFPGIPILCKCFAVNRKLVLMGGFHPSTRSLMTTVYVYDFQSTSWSRGADMPTPRQLFACSLSSSTGLIYVAGGNDEHHNPLASAESYNVEEDKWEILPPMIQQHGYGCQAVFMESKFMVVSEGEFERSAEVFDPSAGTWRMCEDMWSLEGDLCESCVVSTSSGELYVFIKKVIMKYDSDRNVWTTVAYLPPHIDFVMCAIQCRDLLFVSGYDRVNTKVVCYIFNPSTGQSIDVNSDGWGDIVTSAVTVEI